MAKTEEYDEKLSPRCNKENAESNNYRIQQTNKSEEAEIVSPQNVERVYDEKGGFMSEQMQKSENSDNELLLFRNLNERGGSFMSNQLSEHEICGATLPHFSWEDDCERRVYFSQQISETEKRDLEYTEHIMCENYKSDFKDETIAKPEDYYVESPNHSTEKNNEKKELNNCHQTRGKFFFYDSPHYEETGAWIPVSVPPMSESELEEWSRGSCPNGGYFPEGDMGWSQYIGDDKELTMWDVVVEMLLVARGKVSAAASGDIYKISWICSDLIEKSWKDMAQTLTEVNLGNIQEVLEAEPPKWLPDSASSACMLCSVRFHPIMCTRHHCRFCGGIFCNDCTKGRSLLPEKFRVADPQRVCDVCSVRIESVQPYLMNEVSRASQLPTHDLTDLSTLRSWVNFPWGQSMEYEIYKATNTIRGYNKVGVLKPEKSIPEAILLHAKGLAILTIVKVGVMVTYNVGTGLVVARREDGSWSPPSAISSFGAGWGAQAGGELVDLVIVLRSNDAIKTFCGDMHLSIGAGLGAAFGIFGRKAEADLRAGTAGCAACYTYSCSKGAYVGCSMEGSVFSTRGQENARFYGSKSINASDILLGSLPRPPAAAILYHALADLYQKFEG